MRRLIFRETASQQMYQIAAYTKRQWGILQAQRYSARLRERIKSLQKFPERYPQVHQRPGIRQMRCGQHIVFYRVTNTAIEIINIVHVAADIDSWA